ncbi:MAG: flagellin N-terminal helical domain-containing protein [Paracoccaceae bacterium]
MSSILTNNGAMVALQTLKSINSNLGKTQDMISTGKSVASAKDNAALWAISKVMESDLNGFKAISSSLALGQSTVSVARQASERVTDLLTQMKEKIVASQEQNVDRGKIQSDIDALREQIAGITTASQFNGLNLLSNRSAEAGTGSVNILASLDRSDSGVAASDIAVRKQDLGTTASSVNGTTWTIGTAVDSGTLAATQSDTLTIAAPTAAGQLFGLSIFGTDADNSSFSQADYRTGTAATPTNIGEATAIRYISREGDTAADVAKGLANAFKIYAAENGLESSVLNIDATGSGLAISSTATTVGDTIAVAVFNPQAGAGSSTTIGGGLEALNDIDVATDAGAASALTSIEFMIETAIGSAANFGSAQGRIDTQAAFVSQMSDALRSGIGTLVDADMEEASARLQALQVQQQLGIQSLSIANQAPQSILSLFR